MIRRVVTNKSCPITGGPITGGPKTGSPMTGGMAIVDALIANGVERVYGLPGAQMYPLFDALHQRSDQIRTFGARHEQTCGYMAFGEARSTGNPGVFAVVPGPGVLNTAAALVTALGCCAPVLCITGQVPSEFIGRGRGHLHEIPDQLATLKSITKWAARIERVEDAPEVINEAFRQMLSGRPGPVAIEMAWDVMSATAQVARLPAAVIPISPKPTPSDIDAASRLVVAANRPMIMVGSGAQHAGVEVLELAELLDAPVMAFRGGRGIVAENHALSISSYAANQLWPTCDLLIGIGTRLEMPYMRWSGMMALIDRPAAPPHLIRIDIDPSEMQRLIPHAGIIADAVTGTRTLIDAIKFARSQRALPTPADRRYIANVKKEARGKIEKVQPQLAYLDVIRACLPDDGFFVSELSQVGFTSYFGFEVRAPRTYVSEGYQGTLGFGFPTALGVKAANPDRAVVSVTGDGGFMFAMQELATAAQEQIALVTLLFNNGAYGNVLRDQQTSFGGRIQGAELNNPDFMMLAAAFGIEAHRVASPDALRPVLTAALKSTKPVLIEVSVPRGSEVSPWEFIHIKR
jgi:acetolactate synthase I/II/III large subunit